MALHRAQPFESKPKDIIHCWPLPDDYSEVFVSFFKEFNWKIEDCLNLSIGQIRTIADIFVDQNTPKKRSPKPGQVGYVPKKIKKPSLNALVKVKEQELKRSLTVDEMNEIIDNY